MKYTPRLKAILKELNLSIPSFKMIYCLIFKNLANQPMTKKNYKTSTGDIPNLVKETFSHIIKLSNFLEQFTIQNIVFRPKAISKHGNG